MKKNIVRFFQLMILTVIRLRYWHRVRVHSRPGFNPRGPVVIAANHAKALDPFIIACFVPVKSIFKIFPYGFMTANIFYHGPLKFFCFLAGCFPAKPRNEKSEPKNYGVGAAEKLYGQGYSIVMFPEGTRTNKRIAAKPGISRILEQTNAPLILCHIAWQTNGKITLSLQTASQQINRNDPKAIMDAIYELPLSNKTPILKEYSAT